MVNLTIAGVSFPYPERGDTGWGIDATEWATAVSASALWKSGGAFTLTAETDFGANFGLKSVWFKSRTTNAASAGVVRLANADTVKWRKFDNSGDVTVGVNGSNQLTFEGSAVGTNALTFTDTATVDFTLSGIDVSAIVVAGSLSNTHIANAAAIAVNKLAAVTVSKALVSDGSGFVSASSVTATELGYLSGVTSAIQTQIGTKITTGAAAIVNADVNAAAAIVLTKLAAVTGSRALESSAGGVIQSSSVTSTELGYLSGVTSAIQTQFGTKITSGAGAIVNADVNAAAAIAVSKLATVTASRALESSAGGVIQASSVTSTELAYLSGVTSAIQTQLNALNTNFQYVELEDYGGVADGATSNTAALNSAVTAAVALGITRIHLRAGTYRFNTKPTNFTNGIRLLGHGYSQTVLERNYSEAGGAAVGLFTWVGATSNGGGIQDCSVWAGNGTTGGSLLVFKTNVDESAGFHFVDRCVLTYTGTGTHLYCIYADGQNNDVVGAQGIRDLNVTDSYLFHGSSGTECALFINATNFYGSGVWANGDVNFSGGGTALSNTTDAYLSLICLGELFVEQTKYLYLDGITNTLIFSTGSEQCTFAGTITTTVGGFSDTGTNNLILSRFASQRLNSLVALTASKALVSDSSGVISAATTTSTEIGYVAGVTSALQTQLDARANPNDLINSNFEIWQEGTSFSAVGTKYTAEGWQTAISGTGLFDIAQDTSVPSSASAFSHKLTVNTQDTSLAAGDIYFLQQRMEGLDFAKYGFGGAAAKSLTLTFWVKSSVTGTYCVCLTNSAGTRAYVAEYAISSANTWEQKTVVFPGDTTGTWLLTNSTGVRVCWNLGCGSTFQTTANSWQAGNFFATSNQTNLLNTAAATWFLAQVKAEVGGLATAYMHAPYAVELLRCQRRFVKTFALATTPAQNVGVATGALAAVGGATAGLSVFPWRFPVPMRASPTITTYNPGAANTSARNTTDSTDSAPTATDKTTEGVNITTAAAGDAGDRMVLHATADARL